MSSKKKNSRGKAKLPPKPKSPKDESESISKKSKTPEEDESESISKKSIPSRVEEVPENAKDDTIVEVSTPVKIDRPRKRVTIETHLVKYDELLSLLDEEIEKRQKKGEKGTRVFQTIRKHVRELKNESPKLINSRRATSKNGNKVSGFVLRYQISDELADFMQLPRGATPTKNEITNAICMYIHIKPDEARPQMLKWEHLNPDGKRNLQNPDEKMAIIPDEVLSKLLRYDQYVKDVKAGKITQNKTNKETREMETVKVTDPTLRYWVVQKLIQSQIVSSIKVTA